MLSSKMTQGSFRLVEHLEAYVRELPEDWGLAYLGGQHLYAAKHPPKKISDRVYDPYNVNRTHAFHGAWSRQR